MKAKININWFLALFSTLAFMHLNSIDISYTQIFFIAYFSLSFFFEKTNKEFNGCSTVLPVIFSLLLLLGKYVVYVYKKIKNILFTVISLCFYSFISYNVIYSTSISKGSIYASFLIFIICLNRYSERREFTYGNK